MSLIPFSLMCRRMAVTRARKGSRSAVVAPIYGDEKHEVLKLIEVTRARTGWTVRRVLRRMRLATTTANVF